MTAEANELIPWAKTAQVKKGITTFGAALLPPEKAHALIHDTALQAVKDIKNMKTLVYPSPVKFKVENMERIPLPNECTKPYIKIIDGKTYEIEAPTMEDAFLELCDIAKFTQFF